MPVRINPVYDLGRCVINLESIRKITELLNQNFNDVFCYAIDKTWEIYQEPTNTFLDTISTRDTLDSFRIIGSSSNKEIELVFSMHEAKVSLKANPNEESWFEHFLIDLRKFLLPPAFSQWISLWAGLTADIGIKVLAKNSNTNAFFLNTSPYCRIILRQKTPDPFWENIKANIVSNILWATLVFIVGVLVTLVSTGQLKIPW